MEQLLKITTVPIQYELKISPAHLEYSNSTAELEISKKDGQFQIKSRPAKLNIDTFQARNSVLPNVSTVLSKFAKDGIHAGYTATARYSQEGKLMLKANIGEGNETLNQVLENRTAQPTGDFQLGFLPSAPAEFHYEKPDLQINYEMDKLNFDLKIANGNFEFIPGTIEMTITQMPDVIIEYTGGPIFVPPSADPDYEPIDVRA